MQIWGPKKSEALYGRIACMPMGMAMAFRVLPPYLKKVILDKVWIKYLEFKS